MFILDAISNAVEGAVLAVEAGIAELSEKISLLQYEEYDDSENGENEETEETDECIENQLAWINSNIVEVLNMMESVQSLILGPDDILHEEKQEVSEPELMEDLLSDESKEVIAELSKLNDDNLSDEEKVKIIANLKGKTITLNVDKFIGTASVAGKMELE